MLVLVMKNILIHGLGQNNSSWNKVVGELNKNNIKVDNPNLYLFLKDRSADYPTLLNEFIDYCNAFDDKLNLCGLSLGGILALDYAKKYPNKVNSLILIGVPATIPKFLFKFQGLIFHIMPKSTFTKIGCTKNDFISLVNSMSILDIKNNLDKINNKTLILYGVKDKQNIKSSKILKDNIKNSTFLLIDEASHEVNVDNTVKLADIIKDFWR